MAVIVGVGVDAGDGRVAVSDGGAGSGHRVTRRAELEDVARRVFGWKALRAEQLDAMEALVARRDVLALMPTGAGKSAIYQVAAVLIDGATLVISPLIALQRDQIDHIVAAHGPAAVAINSRQRPALTSRSWEAVRRHEAEYIFLSPEQLSKDDVVSRLAESNVSLIVVDEAHCVSTWGHDFRPDYLRLADAFDRLGRPPVAALTATASPLVRREIIERLGLRDLVVIASGFDRPNLRLEVEHHVSDAEKRDAVVSTVAEMVGPVLVYTATRKDAESYTDALARRGRSAAAYHGGMRAAQRDEIHRRFRDDEYEMITATSAFGMGIDKPNIRAVVHASVPDSLDSYYQQVGRAGRDGEAALALLFYRPEDLSLARFFTAHHPDEELLHRVYSALSADRPKRLKDLRTELGVRGRRLTTAVNLLDQAGAVTSGRKGFAASGEPEATAVGRAVEVVETSGRVDRTRVEMLRGYAETRECRRQILLAYFGETLPQPCGNCDRCRDNQIGEASAHEQRPAIPVNTTVEHREWGPGVVIGGTADTVTVLFEKYGYRTLSMKVIRETAVLRQTRGENVSNA